VCLLFSERISVVCELHNETLADKMCGGKIWDCSAILSLMYEIIQALAFMESHSIIHRALDPGNIMFGSKGEARLFNYGLYYMTGGGKFVSFPIGCVPLSIW
jgi:TBC domain-containing protein kinase-like protein